MKTAFCVVVLTLLSLPVYAQFPEDALRLATPGFGVGARALGMGNAYAGVASDFSALYWNPAGLSQLRFGEFSLGLSHLNNMNTSTFFDQNESYSNNNTSLNTLGFVYPVNVYRGSLVFAFGYSRQSNFTSGVSFEGFNPFSSIIQSYAPDGQSAPADPAGNLAWELFLADTVGRQWLSPIRSNVTQAGRVIEGGGLDNWSLGGAVEVAKDVSLGLTLTYLSGSYRYDRDYTEEDTRNVYTTADYPYDFHSLAIEEFVDGDISGVNAKFGVLYTQENRFRLGIAVKVPTKFTVKETFRTTATSVFDSISASVGNVFGPFESNGAGEYDVITPWVFSAGASFTIRDLVLAADIEYTDWSTLEFKNANPDLIALNKDMRDIFRATLNWKLGAEYEFRQAGFRVRGGFIYNRSPYEEDESSSYDQKYATAGLGILLGESVMLDVAYARGWWDTFRVNYDRSSTVEESITTNNVILTLSFRY